jgi:acyl-CoA thioesterase I
MKIRAGKIRAGLLALAIPFWVVLLSIGRPVLAAGCPTPDGFGIPTGDLPAAKAAVGKQALTILALGGASTLGGPANGAEFTWPSRLTARLSQAMPNVTFKIAVLAIPRLTEAELEEKLDASLTREKPALVIWGPGASAAGRGDDLDTFIGGVTGTIGKINAAGADLILMTLQYAPSLARVINLYPYRTAVVRAAEIAGVPLFDRYELMRFWSDTDFLDLDATKAEDRIWVARKLYDCMAEILAEGIVDAVR